MTARYRVCKNTAPHVRDWWTVEKLTFGFWWRRQKRLVCSIYIGGYEVSDFDSEEQALEWVKEARKAKTHVCSEASA